MKSIWTAVVFAGSMLAGETKVKLENLPPAVQAAVKEQTKNATLVGLSTETEKGRTMYEVETKVNGRGRDLLLDQTGAVVETEDEVDLDSIPAPARDAIRKRAAGRTITKVEKLTAGSNVSYEAAIKSKAGKNIEIGVNADGTPHKEN
jgi:uncharacterized protein with beta-barrel porin domain